MNRSQMIRAVEGQVSDGGFAGLGWPASKVKKADALVDRVRKRNAAASIAMIENGRDLVELKSMCAHGEFEAALQVKVGIGRNHASKMIAGYEWARSNNLVDAKGYICTHLANIDVLAVRLLASKKGADSSPKAVRLASEGARVTESMVKGWIAQSTPPVRTEESEKQTPASFDFDISHKNYLALPKERLIDELINLMNDGGITLDDLSERLVSMAREVA